MFWMKGIDVELGPSHHPEITVLLLPTAKSKHIMEFLMYWKTQHQNVNSDALLALAQKMFELEQEGKK